MLTDDGRRADWVVEVRCERRPEAQLLGSAIGMRVMADVPYITGLDAWLGDELDGSAKAYLKDMGAACASNGAVGLYHVEGLTPEAREQGRALVREGARVYVIDDAELERVHASYPVVWKNADAKPKLCFMGCPHMSMEVGRTRVSVPCVFTAAPAVAKRFAATPAARVLDAAGVVVSSICPLMYMNNPLSAKMPVITNSNKLRTYSSARYYTDDEILDILTKGAR